MTWPHVLGVDLGQSQDYTALSLLEESLHAPAAACARLALPAPGWVSPAALTAYQLAQLLALTERYGRPAEPPLSIRHLERFALGTPYPAIVRRVQALLATPPLRDGTTALVLDATGCGAAVVDLFREAGLRPVAVSITAGNTATIDGAAARVPKRDLVATMAVLLERRRLRIAAGLPEAATLLRELTTFRRTITPQGHDSYASWRESDHDDLVLATALACWFRGWWSAHLDRHAPAYQEPADVALARPPAPARPTRSFS